MTFVQRHFRSYKVTCVLLITSYGNKIQKDIAKGMVSLVQLAKTHRLICAVILFGHHLILMARDLRSTFVLDLLELTVTCSNVSRRENHFGVRTVAALFFVEKFFPEK